MALRLQGNLLPEQLVLQDDPSFLPEFAVPPPELLADLNFSFDLHSPRSGESQSLTPFGSQRSSQSSYVAGFGLVLPSSSPIQPNAFRLEADDGAQGDAGVPNIDNLLQLDEPDFTFGEDGDLIEFSLGKSAPMTPQIVEGAPMHSDAAASARVRKEHEDGQQGGDQVLVGQMDLNLPAYGDDAPEAEASSPAVNQQHGEHSQIITSSSTVAAPMRRKKRAARSLPQDTRMELCNTELLSWNTNYLNNMKDAARSNVKKHVLQQAKKNAEYYVWSSGIGGLGQDAFGPRGPFDRFIGDDLFELFTGTSRKTEAKPKRDRDSGIDEATHEEARRKRPKTVEPELETGRQEDEGLFVFGGDDEVELPREAVSALDDQQIFSAMPWNISASKRGSSVVPHSGRVTLLSEKGRQGSRAGSRVVSASPLLRRSTGRADALETLQILNSDALEGDDFAFAMPISDPVEDDEATIQPSRRLQEALSAEGGNFITFVADAIVEKRVQAQVGLASRPDVLLSEATVDTDEITFEELLPPHETNRTIASQGFLMLLSLGMKGMLHVQQPTAFTDIAVKLTKKAKTMQIVEIDDDNESKPQTEDNMSEGSSACTLEAEEQYLTQDGIEKQVPQPEDSHFQEQMAASYVSANENSDRDSLYDD
ncbi:R8 protein [Neodidymelliopsis sp. IMI 364377]|nr:R8 protein [Neodidymelliopsis sp. IMI 364377]